MKKIWKIDILPNWELHWDYQARKPKNLDIYRKKKKQEKDIRLSEPRKHEKQNAFSKLLSCFSKSKTPNKNNDFSSYDDEIDTDEEIKSLCRNKSLLLVILWKKGIPPWVRKTLWPIAIGNRLEVDYFKKIFNKISEQNLLRSTETYTTFYSSKSIVFQKSRKDMIKAFYIL